MLGLLLVVGAYLCGSVPTGVWAARRVGIDVRREGSGNIGATNVARTAGVGPAILTLAGDVAKGFVPVFVARVVGTPPWLAPAAAVATVVGHLYPAFSQFAGGKGVATGFGALLALAPAAAGMAAALFLVVARLWQYASLASVCAAVGLPIVAGMLGYAGPTRLAALVVAMLITVRHRDNLVRLRDGTEPRFRVAGR